MACILSIYLLFSGGLLVFVGLSFVLAGFGFIALRKYMRLSEISLGVPIGRFLFVLAVDK